MESKKVINDFSMTFGTINGSGSATANIKLLSAIFKMGIPVSGKNIFPSNIKSLPTWYTIRVNKDGYLARQDDRHIVVAMNPQTFEKDVESIISGGVLYYSTEIKKPISRDDIVVYPIPIGELAKEAKAPPKLLNYMKNMVYVGILSQMLGIDIKKIKLAIDFHFDGKKVAVDANFHTISLAAEWAKGNLKKRDPYYVEEIDKKTDYILTNGNTSAALGSIFGGVQFVAWYPITPATNIAERLDEYLPKFRKDPDTGKNTFAVVQAEDELSAIGMAIGAGWGGLRAMTSTSGPGLSLMAEYMGLAYFSEIPVVVWDVQRMGPSTGMPTRTSQGDITFANYLGQGDTRYVILFPSSMAECFEFGWKSFSLAERLQIPVIILSDLDLGMNQWISEKYEYPDEPIDRGKILWEDEFEELLQERKGDWGRYLDVDGDGIPYRTIVGNRHPRSGYFSRGTGRDPYANYSEDPQVWESEMKRLAKKYQTAKSFVPKPDIKRVEGAKYGIISCGSTDMAIGESRDILLRQGIPTNYMRIKAIPFTSEVREFIQSHERNYVVEMNEDGQLRQLLMVETPQNANRLFKITKNDGLPITAQTIVEKILVQEGEKDEI
ncbi:MAG: 2-oxoacid:acceptor oxidoreductase subunit alpha [Anaerolineaceae bacterium]|nr:2-oxoacid:acceptor oxidoreductase subunit alpha [Anaerolineaceae bacterium]